MLANIPPGRNSKVFLVRLNTVTPMTARRRFQPDDLFNLRVVGDPQLSPDGERVAYVVATHDRDADEVRSSIWVAAADGSTAPRRFSTGTKDNSPRWSPDGQALLF